MTSNQDMGLSDIFGELDAIAESSVIQNKACRAASYAVRSLREAASALGLDSENGVESIGATVKSLQNQLRLAHQHTEDCRELLSHWAQLANVCDDSQAVLGTATSAFLEETNPAVSRLSSVNLERALTLLRKVDRTPLDRWYSSGLNVEVAQIIRDLDPVTD